MIKRIIFDLDNTLIDWKDEYWTGIENALKKSNIKYLEDDTKIIINAMNCYESNYEYYKKEDFFYNIKQYTNLNIGIEFLENCLQEFSKCVPEKLDSKIIETLEYLYQKYELVILTNWFKESQEKRLETAGIRKYFKQIYTPESFKMKPNKEAFEIASEGKINECIMVGDSLKSDINGALNAGMKAIYINKEGKENKDYITIKTLDELKNIL